jgi:hypothetical protein
MNIRKGNLWKLQNIELTKNKIIVGPDGNISLPGFGPWAANWLSLQYTKEYVDKIQVCLRIFIFTTVFFEISFSHEWCYWPCKFWEYKDGVTWSLYEVS